MVTLAKYLREGRPDGDGRLPVEIRVCWRGKKLRFQPGVRVHPDHWSEGGFQKEKTPAARASNRRLNTFTDCLEDYFDACVSVPTTEQVAAEISRIRVEELGETPRAGVPRVAAAPPPAPALSYPALLDFFQQYIHDHRASLSDSSLRTAEVVAQHLATFRPGIGWPDLTLSTLNQFKTHLAYEEELSDNTVAAYVSTLRAVCKYAEQLEIPLPRGHQFVKSSSADSIRASLNRADLSGLETADLQEVPRDGRNRPLSFWEDFRDLVLLHCYTGLRHIDLHQLTLSRVKIVDGTPCLTYIQQKTGSRVTLPLIGPAYRILQRHPEGLPIPPRYQYNRDFRQLAKMAKLKRPVVVSTSRQGKMQDKTKLLWEVCSSHVCRHTFATLMLSGGMNPAVLQNLMGHATIDSTMRYPEISSNMIISQTLEAWRLGSAA